MCIVFRVIFFCIALLLPFVLGFCLSIFFNYYKKIFNNFFYFNNFVILFYFIFCFLSFFLFLLPFILSCVDDRLLVLQPGVRAVHLRWESQVQDTGPQETSQLHVISNGEDLPQISISMPKPSFTQQLASYSAGHPMQNN